MISPAPAEHNTGTKYKNEILEVAATEKIFTLKTHLRLLS